MNDSNNISAKDDGSKSVKRRQPRFVAMLAGCLVDAAGVFVTIIRLLAAAVEMSERRDEEAAAWQIQRYIYIYY